MSMKIGIADLRSFSTYSQLLSFKTLISQLLCTAVDGLTRGKRRVYLKPTLLKTSFHKVIPESPNNANVTV